MTKHPNLRIAFQAAAGLILLRLLLFFFGYNFDYIDSGFLFLSLAALIPLTIYSIWPRGMSKSFIQEFTASMRVTALFGLIIVVFLFLFYQFLETEYFDLTRDQILNTELSKYAEQNDGKIMPLEQSQELKTNIEQFFSLRNYSAIVLVTFIVLSAFYSIVFSALKRILIKPR